MRKEVLTGCLLAALLAPAAQALPQGGFEAQGGGAQGGAQAGSVQRQRQHAGAVVLREQHGRVTSESRARYSTREGARLRMTAEIGTIRVRTIPGAQEVTVLMQVETDSRQPDAQRLLKQVTLSGASLPDGVQIISRVPWNEFRGRLWVRFEVSTPRNYNLEIATHAGNITTEDVEGRVVLLSQGGNIEAGNVGGSARLETQGGHVVVKNVGGELTAITAGGHVTAGHVAGAATLRSGGGHIRVGVIDGAGTAETAGGDIAVVKAGPKFSAVSEGGGQITFGEAAGAIEARTAGGGIRVLNVPGPTQLNTEGNIYLTQIRDGVRASTASGNITAWFTGDGKKKTPSQLQCTEGDILVYLPRQMALNIEATIEGATNQQVTWDPAIPIKFVASPKVAKGQAGRVVRAAGTVNGGGETLRLHTVAGNIRLMLADQASGEARTVILRQIDMEKQVRMQQEVHRQLESHMKEMQERLAQQQAESKTQDERTRVEALRAKLEEFFSRAVRVSPAEQHEKLRVSIMPVYPEAARAARVEGIVSMEALLAEDGRVEEIRSWSGHPLLVPAAKAAVAQWQYRPTLVGGRPVRVITRIDVQFKLN